MPGSNLFLLKLIHAALMNPRVLQFRVTLVKHITLDTLICTKDMSKAFPKHIQIIRPTLEWPVNPNDFCRLYSKTNFIFISRTIKLLAKVLCIKRPRFIDWAVGTIDRYEATAFSIPIFKSIRPFYLVVKDTINVSIVE